MNRNAAFVRKVGYITAIALLLLPLSALSQPATLGRQGSSPGGKLAQLRTQYNLAQADLGEIDPASASMKLASFGMSGIAADVLWGYANHYKKVEDWDKLELTVQQIIRLQPNFLEVWDFQAHNLSYNVSVEFDDYRMRYQWVKKGIDFMILGTHYNRQEPGLLNQVGWFVGQKIGRSDERVSFRRLFKDDTDFHEVFRDNGVEVDQDQAKGPDAKPDNWLVARLWFNRATDAVTFSGKPIRGKSPLLFYSGAPMAQINGASAMQEDGYFFQRAQAAWQKADDDWTSYGNRELPTTAGFNIRLNDKESLDQRVKTAYEEIDKLTPSIRETMKQEKVATLPPDRKAAYDKPLAERSVEERALAEDAERLIKIYAREVAARAPAEVRPKLRNLIEQIENDELTISKISGDRRIVNFDYWRTRCQAEKTPLTQGARKAVYDSDKLFLSGEKFEEAKKLYEKAWLDWAQIFKQHPILMESAEAQDLIDSVKKYRNLLGQLDEPFPSDFVLNNLLDLHPDGQQLRDAVRLINEATVEPKTTPETKKEPETKKKPETTKEPEPKKEPEVKKESETKPEPKPEGP